jgi:hypothetical protein
MARKQVHTYFGDSGFTALHTYNPYTHFGLLASRTHSRDLGIRYIAMDMVKLFPL